MADKKSLALRAKIIGVLLRDARLAAGKNLKECGAVLGLTSGAYSAYEFGKKALALPELELLAYYLDTPLTHFWSDDIKSEKAERASEVNTTELIKLRQRIIGAELRQARQAKGLSQKELASAVGVPPGRIKAYEFGQHPIPIPELETMGWVLGLTVDHFFEKQGPVGEWDTQRRAFENFQHLPPEMKEFIGRPANESFLRIAMHLSALSTAKLRALAEGLLDITY